MTEQKVCENCKDVFWSECGPDDGPDLCYECNRGIQLIIDAVKKALDKSNRSE